MSLVLWVFMAILIILAIGLLAILVSGWLDGRALLKPDHPVNRLEWPKIDELVPGYWELNPEDRAKALEALCEECPVLAEDYKRLATPIGYRFPSGSSNMNIGVRSLRDELEAYDGLTGHRINKRG